MKLEIFSMYDQRAGAFITPFFLPNLAMALRGIKSAAESETHMFHKHPNDFALYKLGSFDDSSAKLETLMQPEHIGLVSQIVEEYDSAVQIIPKDYDAQDGKATLSDGPPVLDGPKGGNSAEHIRP